MSDSFVLDASAQAEIIKIKSLARVVHSITFQYATDEFYSGVPVLEDACVFSEVIMEACTNLLESAKNPEQDGGANMRKENLHLPDIGFSDDWKGWYYYDRCIHDPDGNKYHTDMVRASFFGRQLYAAQVGDPYKIRILKQHLENRNKPRSIDIHLELDMFGQVSVKSVANS